MSETPQSWLTEYLPPGSIIKTNISSKKPAQEDNAMNKSVTNLWNMHKSPAASNAATPTVSGAATPLEVATPINEESPVIPATTATATATAATTEIDTPVDSTKSKKRTKATKESGSSKRPKSKTYIIKMK